jgi:hypothetical protein
VLAGKHPGKLHLADFLLQIGEHPAHFSQCLLVFDLSAKLYQNLGIFQAAANRIAIRNQFLQDGPFLQDFLGLLVVIPEFRLGNLGLQLCNPLPLAVNVKDTSSARRACPGGFSAIRSLHETLFSPLIIKRTANYNRRKQIGQALDAGAGDWGLGAET